jgi:hypothetical protein
MIVSKCCHASIYYVPIKDDNDIEIQVAHCDKCNQACKLLAVNEKESNAKYSKVEKGF